jgi:hypothetical protein
VILLRGTINEVLRYIKTHFLAKIEF